MTNAEKFEKVFGYFPDTSADVCECPEYSAGESCKYNDDYGCHCEDWWLEEYNEKTGHWKIEKSLAGVMFLMCSNCGKGSTFRFSYCPYCGIKMGGGDKE